MGKVTAVATAVIGVCISLNLFVFVSTGMWWSALAVGWCAFCLWMVCEDEVRWRRRVAVLEHFMELSRKARAPWQKR